MAEPRRTRLAESSQTDEPAAKRATTRPSASALSPPSAASLCHRPIHVAGPFGGPRFAARPDNSANFSANVVRSAFAKTLVGRHTKSQAAVLTSPERNPVAIPGKFISQYSICTRGAGKPRAIEKEINISTQQKIGIIGAGMAGLYSALILDSLGFTNYEILEAHPDRVGGRVYTGYFDDVPECKCSKWNYIDYGAMRFPCITIMDRLIGKQPWSLTNYLNAVIKEEEHQIKLLEYYLSVDNNIHYYNSTRKTNAELREGTPDPLHFGRSKGGGLEEKYVQKWYTAWLDPVFEEFKNLLAANLNIGFRELMRQDHFSVRAYLRTVRGPDETLYSPELIDYLETLDSGTGQYDDAFSEAVLDSFDFASPPDPAEDGSVKWKCVEGGTCRFADAMKKVIKTKPEMRKKVLKIAQAAAPDGSIDVFVAGESQARTYHHVINTLPPAVVRSLDTAQCDFSYDKRTALRMLRVGSSVKIGLLFKSRWWQNSQIMRGKPIRGGQSSTDLPIRTIVYPSYGIDDPDASGVLIASYTWGQDAARLSALAAAGRDQLVQLAISNIATVHDIEVALLMEQFTGKSFIQDWDQYEYSQGAFALFGPGQFTSLFKGLQAPEMKGRYHTAGEMSSAHHRWIVGALNSAWRCVYEILYANGQNGKIADLIEKWGTVEEIDMGAEVM